MRKRYQIEFFMKGGGTAYWQQDAPFEAVFHLSPGSLAASPVLVLRNGKQVMHLLRSQIAGIYQYELPGESNSLPH